MLPPEAITKAALRWLRLIRTSTIEQAWAILRGDAVYLDLTPTQYATALDWLRELGFVTERLGYLVAASEVMLPESELGNLLFQTALQHDNPPWLVDADLLLGTPGDLPSDAASFAAALHLTDSTAFIAARSTQVKVDPDQLSELGLSGEKALVAFLEHHWPGSTTHVALTSDCFGYDIVFRPYDIEWHLEVKTTVRRGRLSIFLSRHEFEVASKDSRWRLIALGLDQTSRIKAIATIRHEQVLARSPRDTTLFGRWQSAKHEIAMSDLETGLPFVTSPAIINFPVDESFAWAPVIPVS
jgi:hypothetical protein